MNDVSRTSEPNGASDTPVLAAATTYERSSVLTQLLASHPELTEEAERLAAHVLMSTSPDAVADEVADELGSLGFEDLAGVAGRIPGRGYVNEFDAAWEVLEAALEPYLSDIRRHASLGFVESAQSIASGTIAGLDRLEGSPNGELIAFAGGDAISELVETVSRLTDDLGIALGDTSDQDG